GIYGHDIDTSLAELIRSISAVDGLKRLRLGSLEPFCLTDELMNALADCKPFCHHLHLPLQSGDDKILASMRRGYTAEDFVKVCGKARAVISDDLHISSDILVGFPDESDSAFSNTLDVMKASGMGRVHVFPYSAREGTLAAKMPNQIPHAVKISRTSEAITLGKKLFSCYAKRFIGREAEILIERNGKGHTRHYIEAECTCNSKNENEIVKAEVIRFADGRFECLCRD
ncbi:MAG: radical SAM protein, partial [Synergistaceae bacterium]|nr:radical SAM protein [Synergistaceae bacterium]